MLLPYNQNQGALVNPQFNRAPFPPGNDISESELLGSLFGLAHQLMAEVLRSTRDCAAVPPFIGMFPNNLCPKVFGISAMNVTRVTRGPDGRPHVVQAHNERRMGPGGVWQTKKALHDPDRGIEKVQIGYFTGDHGEVIERRFDRATGQYREEIQRRDFAPNDSNLPPRLPLQPPPSVQKQQHPYYPPAQPSYPYYPPQQQQQQPYPFYPQAQLKPVLPSYLQQPISALAPYPLPQLQHQPVATLTPYPEKTPQNRPPPPAYPYI